MISPEITLLLLIVVMSLVLLKVKCTGFLQLLYGGFGGEVGGCGTTLFSLSRSAAIFSAP